MANRYCSPESPPDMPKTPYPSLDRNVSRNITDCKHNADYFSMLPIVSETINSNGIIPFATTNANGAFKQANYAPTVSEKLLSDYKKALSAFYADSRYASLDETKAGQDLYHWTKSFTTNTSYTRYIFTSIFPDPVFRVSKQLVIFKGEKIKKHCRRGTFSPLEMERICKIDPDTLKNQVQTTLENITFKTIEGPEKTRYVNFYGKELSHATEKSSTFTTLHYVFSTANGLQLKIPFVTSID